MSVFIINIMSAHVPVHISVLKLAGCLMHVLNAPDCITAVHLKTAVIYSPYGNITYQINPPNEKVKLYFVILQKHNSLKTHNDFK